MKKVLPISEELINLAKKVIASLPIRKKEDIKEWAKNLAKEVADAND